MCCSVCPKFACHSAISLRLHNARHSGMPAPHYHLCKSVKPCTLDCRSCISFIKEAARPPGGHFEYGCCHLCPSYGNCRDFVQKHLADAPQYTPSAPDAHGPASAHTDHGLRPAPPPAH